VLDAHSNQASCRFSVTVSDTQPPAFNCPANIYTALSASCPIPSSAPVSYAYPTATDNCAGGLAVTCNPPTGSTFPIGSTTVHCAATDAAGNLTTCSFKLNVFSFCLVDDSNPGNVVLVNALTGDYRYCCNAKPIASGQGVLTVQGCTITIDHTKGNRRVLIQASLFTATGAGTATIQVSGGPTCQITDRAIAGNQCTCN
jgi:hypothetical protein